MKEGVYYYPADDEIGQIVKCDFSGYRYIFWCPYLRDINAYYFNEGDLDNESFIYLGEL